MEVLHRGFNDAALTTNRLIAEAVQSEIHVVYSRHIVDNVILKVPQHVEIRVLEHVEGKVIVHRRDPASVDAEEEAKLLREVALLYVGARFLWYPQLLRVSRRLEVNEAEGADQDEDEADEDRGPWACC